MALRMHFGTVGSFRPHAVELRRRAVELKRREELPIDRGRTKAKGKNKSMRTNIQALVVLTGLLASSATLPAFGQTADHSKMGNMSGTKMSHDEMIAKMDKMSKGDKAALIDKMSVKDKKAAMKTSGQDVSKMSAQDKADMFDKMPMDKKMTMMMAAGSMMQKGGKMGKMDKTDK